MSINVFYLSVKCWRASREGAARIPPSAVISLMSLFSGLIIVSSSSGLNSVPEL